MPLDLYAFLQASPAAEGVSEPTLRLVAEEFSAGVTPVSLLEKGQARLPADTLRRLAEAWREHQRYLEKAQPLLNRVPEELLSQARALHQLEALERALPVAPGSLAACLDLWNRSVALCRKHGFVIAEGKANQGFDDYIKRRELLGELPPHRWLRMRRGEREALLNLRLELPLDALDEQAALLGLSKEVLDAVVVTPLPNALRRVLDDDAEREAIRSAQSLYAQLLTAAPLTEAPVLALAIGRKLGAAVMDAAGEVIEGGVYMLLRDVEGLAARHQARGVVLQTKAPEAELLTEARRRLSQGRVLIQVSPAGVARAAQATPGPRPVANAVVLGRRAIRPMEEWSRIDPVELGVAEYQADLDERRLREALLLARDLARLEGPNKLSAPRASYSLGAGVIRLQELRPGAILQGVITNLTPFGAFVNLGIEQEGLIHVSELADRFVKDPAEVVKPGQSVLARVLSLDASSGRISLSLRREEKPKPRNDAASVRSRVYSDLEALFKK